MPQEAPPACLIVGEQANLQRIGFSDVETLISHRVSAKVGEGVFLFVLIVILSKLNFILLHVLAINKKLFKSVIFTKKFIYQSLVI